ncbi:DmsC/YnfH family molybdoenzyme membrane anchor subunit [Shigella flexneri]
MRGVVSVMQGAELATIHSAVQQAAALVPDYGALMSGGSCLRHCPVLVDCTTAKRLWPAVSLLSVSFILLLAGN